MIIDYTRRIYGFECDIYGHLNNANYLHLLEECRSEALLEIDMPIQKMLNLGWHVYVHRVELDYIKAARLEDIVTVKSVLLELNRARSKWQQDVYNFEGELCLRAHVYVVHVKNGKPARVPDEIWEHFIRLT